MPPSAPHFTAATDCCTHIHACIHCPPHSGATPARTAHKGKVTQTQQHPCRRHFRRRGQGAVGSNGGDHTPPPPSVHCITPAHSRHPPLGRTPERLYAASGRCSRRMRRRRGVAGLRHRQRVFAGAWRRLPAGNTRHWRRHALTTGCESGDAGCTDPLAVSRGLARSSSGFLPLLE